MNKLPIRDKKTGNIIGYIERTPQGRFSLLDHESKPVGKMTNVPREYIESYLSSKNVDRTYNVQDEVNFRNDARNYYSANNISENDVLGTDGDILVDKDGNEIGYVTKTNDGGYQVTSSQSNSTQVYNNADELNDYLQKQEYFPLSDKPVGYGELDPNRNVNANQAYNQLSANSNNLFGFNQFANNIQNIKPVDYKKMEQIIHNDPRYRGKTVKESVKNFQRQINQAGILDKRGKRLVEDGIVGPKTFSTIQNTMREIADPSVPQVEMPNDISIDSNKPPQIVDTNPRTFNIPEAPVPPNTNDEQPLTEEEMNVIRNRMNKPVPDNNPVNNNPTVIKEDEVVNDSEDSNSNSYNLNAPRVVQTHGWWRPVDEKSSFTRMRTVPDYMRPSLDLSTNDNTSQSGSDRLTTSNSGDNRRMNADHVVGDIRVPRIQVNVNGQPLQIRTPKFIKNLKEDVKTFIDKQKEKKLQRKAERDDRYDMLEQNALNRYGLNNATINDPNEFITPENLRTFRQDSRFDRRYNRQLDRNLDRAFNREQKALRIQGRNDRSLDDTKHELGTSQQEGYNSLEQEAARQKMKRAVNNTDEHFEAKSAIDNSNYYKDKALNDYGKVINVQQDRLAKAYPNQYPDVVTPDERGQANFNTEMNTRDDDEYALDIINRARKFKDIKESGGMIKAQRGTIINPYNSNTSYTATPDGENVADNLKTMQVPQIQIAGPSGRPTMAGALNYKNNPNSETIDHTMPASAQTTLNMHAALNDDYLKNYGDPYSSDSTNTGNTINAGQVIDDEYNPKRLLYYGNKMQHMSNLLPTMYNTTKYLFDKPEVQSPRFNKQNQAYLAGLRSNTINANMEPINSAYQTAMNMVRQNARGTGQMMGNLQAMASNSANAANQAQFQAKAQNIGYKNAYLQGLQGVGEMNRQIMSNTSEANRQHRLAKENLGTAAMEAGEKMLTNKGILHNQEMKDYISMKTYLNEIADDYKFHLDKNGIPVITMREKGSNTYKTMPMGAFKEMKDFKAHLDRSVGTDSTPSPRTTAPVSSPASYGVHGGSRGTAVKVNKYGGYQPAFKLRKGL